MELLVDSTFSTILNRQSRILGLSIRQMFAKMIRGNVDITERWFYQYCKGSAVPDLSMSIKILNALNIEIDDINDLVVILENSKLYQEQIKNIQLDTTKNVSISINLLNLLNLGYSLRELPDVIDERVASTSNSFSDYVTKLIQEDLSKNILKPKNKVRRNNK